MSTVEFTTTTPILDATRQAVPEMTIRIEAEQSSPDESAGNRLLFWATGSDFEAFERALAEDATVTEPRVIADLGSSRLYRVILTNEGMTYTAQPRWVELDGMLLEAESAEDGWSVRMQFPDHSTIAEFRSWFVERDLPFQITGLYESSDTSNTTFDGRLTELQRETLIRAYQAGYFDVPREASLRDLADRLGVSDSAVSQRLRRGMATIVESEMRGDRQPD